MGGTGARADALARGGAKARSKARQGKARQDNSRQGMARGRKGRARQVRAGPGTARQGRRIAHHPFTPLLYKFGTKGLYPVNNARELAVKQALTQ
jgi:hypothetical protein